MKDLVICSYIFLWRARKSVCASLLKPRKLVTDEFLGRRMDLVTEPSLRLKQVGCCTPSVRALLPTVTQRAKIRQGGARSRRGYLVVCLGKKGNPFYTRRRKKGLEGQVYSFKKNKNNTYSASLSTTSTPDASGEGAVLLKSESHTAEMDGIYLR